MDCRENSDWEVEGKLLGKNEQNFLNTVLVSICPSHGGIEVRLGTGTFAVWEVIPMNNWTFDLEQSQPI